MDRLWQKPGFSRWNINKVVMAELQRERGDGDSQPTLLHPNKISGDEKIVEDVDEKSSV